MKKLNIKVKSITINGIKYVCGCGNTGRCDICKANEVKVKSEPIATDEERSYGPNRARYHRNSR